MDIINCFVWCNCVNVVCLLIEQIQFTNYVKSAFLVAFGVPCSLFEDLKLSY